MYEDRLLNIYNNAMLTIGEPLVKSVYDTTPAVEAIRTAFDTEFRALVRKLPWPFTYSAARLQDRRDMVTSTGIREGEAIANPAGLAWDTKNSALYAYSGTHIAPLNASGVPGTSRGFAGVTGVKGVVDNGVDIFATTATELFVLDTYADAAATKLSTAVYADLAGEVVGIAWGNHTLWLVTTEALYTLDVTGKATEIGKHMVSGIRAVYWHGYHLFAVTRAGVYLLNTWTGKGHQVIAFNATLADCAGAAWDGARLWFLNGGSPQNLYSLVPGQTTAARGSYHKPDRFIRVWNWEDGDDMNLYAVDEGQSLRIDNWAPYDDQIHGAFENHTIATDMLTFQRDVTIGEVDDQFTRVLQAHIAARICIRFVESLQLRREIMNDAKELEWEARADISSNRDETPVDINKIGREEYPGYSSARQYEAAMEPARAPAPSPTPTPAGEEGMQVRTISDKLLAIGQVGTIDLSRYVDGAEGTVTYAPGSSDTAIVTVALSESTLTLTPVAAGNATVHVTFRDSDEAITRHFIVTVQAAAEADEMEVRTIGNLVLEA